MSAPKNQHIIPQCYLKQFVDPRTPAGQEPYVWIFERDQRRGRKKAPKNILAEADFYTLKGDYTIEKSLAQPAATARSCFCLAVPEIGVETEVLPIP